MSQFDYARLGFSDRVKNDKWLNLSSQVTKVF